MFTQRTKMDVKLTSTMTNVTKWIANFCHLMLKRLCSSQRGLVKCHQSQMFMLMVRGHIVSDLKYWDITIDSD